MWTHMFALTVPVAEKILRPAIVYVFIVIMLRVFGKRELAQLNPFDLVVLLSVSNTVQNAIIGEDNSVTGGLIGAFTLFAVNYLVVRFLFKHRRLDEILEGTPTHLVEDGHLCHDGLAKELLTESELLTVAHRQGFASLSEVQHCTLEPGGVFYFESKEPRPHDRQHADVMKRLNDLGGQIDDLRRLVSPR
ncbi:MAG TPA: YetF domain-containing protein [Bryobacteraceae bacterium]|nr:YetF domain-containing protein [Bryobacteraceae bacterium]